MDINGSSLGPWESRVTGHGPRCRNAVTSTVRRENDPYAFYMLRMAGTISRPFDDFNALAKGTSATRICRVNTLQEIKVSIELKILEFTHSLFSRCCRRRCRGPTFEYRLSVLRGSPKSNTTFVRRMRVRTAGTSGAERSSSTARDGDARCTARRRRARHGRGTLTRIIFTSDFSKIWRCYSGHAI
ncbi:hypothetical protein K474DRAFT_1383727 [Panus rudis PR-1116 ss-1]|nr:hypothetical protein K474DRAFT_1383727 [Panus rudis PR-1116 ss-1]